jgi:hypothetical protein
VKQKVAHKKTWKTNGKFDDTSSADGKNITAEPLLKNYKNMSCYHTNYRGISLLPTSYKILFNILLSRLSPYIDEIIGDHQCGFRRKSSVTSCFFLCFCAPYTAPFTPPSSLYSPASAGGLLRGTWFLIVGP